MPMPLFLPDAIAPAGPGPGPGPGSASPTIRGGLAPWGGAVAAVAAVTAWSYAPEIGRMMETWVRDRDYSHGWLVLPVSLLILWRRPRPGDVADWRPSAWGWAILVGSLAARAAASEMGFTWVEGATMLPAVLGLALAAGGRGFLGWSWPAFAFLVFMYPMPTRLVALISQPLQYLATVGACKLLRGVGLWVMHEGNIIVVGSEQLEVAAACNGLSMLVSLAATIVATVLLTPMSLTKRVVLFFSIIPIGLACNVIRIAVTAWCYDRYGAKVGGPWAHDIAGWLMMPLAIVLVMAELAIISWMSAEGPEPAPSPIRSPAAPRKSRP